MAPARCSPANATDSASALHHHDDDAPHANRTGPNCSAYLCIMACLSRSAAPEEAVAPLELVILGDCQ